MAAFLRRLVSQNKQRHVEQVGETRFDLDLTYLTEQIICMALPASGSEGLYRNPIESTAKFLEHHHAGKYKIFNLCNERQYDISIFGGACATFPFEDHGAPPLDLIVAFCRSAKSWLLSGIGHVVAIHCKAGKGRTGLMSCCLLMHLGNQPTSEKAIEFYNTRRTKDGKGLTQPSQRRYVRYYERYLKGDTAGLEQPRSLGSVHLLNAPARRPRLRVHFVNHGDDEGRRARATVTLDAAPNAPSGARREALCGFQLCGDLRVEVVDEGPHHHQLLCRCWIHVRLEAGETHLVLQSDKMTSAVEVIEKGALPNGFTVVLNWNSDIATAMLSAVDLAADEEAAVAAEKTTAAAETTAAADAVVAREAIAVDEVAVEETAAEEVGTAAVEPLGALPLVNDAPIVEAVGEVVPDGEEALEASASGVDAGGVMLAAAVAAAVVADALATARATDAAVAASLGSGGAPDITEAVE